MNGDHETEIWIALEEGVLTRQEADTLREEARRLGRGPLELLRERGRLSEETFASLQQRASGPEKPHARPEEVVRREQADAGQAHPLEQVSPLDETASLAPAGASAPPATPAPGDGARNSAFPVPGWDRYQHVGFLGQGGMGRVFLAYDPRLRRQVALKFVRDNHPEFTQRFLSEARAQAKVNHERVCKVYEVGQVGGKVFIAMQYVEGRPLGALVREFTVEQKALVLRETALGVHEAHRAGLIHRDIKPSNIMVERGEDGVPRPYVMDFGLARDWKEGVTVTGTVMGTPHYMAPEQARGEVARLDRRADVYSLGATLYALLTGQPPIQGSNGLEVLNNLATVEPRSPRALDRNIPPDLEAITLKCLEKEPAARYDSARALAEDLDRFLAGEPVLARTGPGYKLRKRLRKHRLLLAVATAALLAVAVAVVGWGAMVTRLEASERKSLARHATELVKDIESTARYSALSRLHDARKDRQALQDIHARMVELEAEIRQGGEQALGPGHYALGRGALALGDPEKAREYLESAWQHGFREPRVAYALALALGQSYQEQLLEAEKIRGNTEGREARLRDIERRYRAPALVFLKQSQGAADSAEYIAALIAFYEGRLDDALAQMDTVSSKLPWLYEAPKLRGDILVVRFYKRWREEDLDGAKADLEAGRKAYAAATAIAESAPSVYQGLAQLERAEMALQSESQGDVMSAYTRSHDALMKWRMIAPDDYMCWVSLAHLHFFMSNNSSEEEALIAKAIEAAERAMTLAPARREARMVLAEIFRSQARFEANGPDSRKLLRKAIELLEGIRSEDRHLGLHRLFAQLLSQWTLAEQNSGEPSLGHLDRAIRESQATLALDERQTELWMNLGRMYLIRARTPRSAEPYRDLTQALLAYDKARSLIHSNKWLVYRTLGGAYEERARWLSNHGGDHMPDLISALAQYRQGLTLTPQDTLFYRLIGAALLKQARETWKQGENPFPLLDDAQASIEQAMSVSPREGDSYVGLGTLLAQRARYLLARGEDPGPSVREAEEVVKRGLEWWRDDPNLLFILGSLYVTRASSNVDRGRAPGSDLARAEEKLRRALAHKPIEKAGKTIVIMSSERAPGPSLAHARKERRYTVQQKPIGKAFHQNKAETWLQLGEAQALRARWQARSGKARAEDFEEAAKSYEQAIELVPDELEYRLRLGQHCSTWATWQKQTGGDHSPVLKRGLELAEQILKIRPDWREAQELHTSLLQTSQ